MFMNVLPTYMYCTICVYYLQKSEKPVGSTGNGITDGCELLCGHWESNPSPLQEQQVFLTAEPPLKPLSFVFNIYICLPHFFSKWDGFEVDMVAQV